MEHVFVVNPAAGNGRAVDEIREKTADMGLENARIYVTRSKGDGTRFVREYCKTTADKVRFYACGGDGTLNEVVNGAAGNALASVCPYPCGSGNDFIKYYGTKEMFSDLPALVNGREVAADLMRVGDRYAVNVVNFGFDTSVCRTVEALRGNPLLKGKRAYAVGVIRAFFTAMRSGYRVRVDGEDISDGEILLCTVANGKYVGGSYKCAPRSDNTDGLLEVCLVKPVSRLKFIRLIGAYAEGKHLEIPELSDFVAYRRGKRVEVESEKDGVCIDGEITDGRRFEIDVVPAGVKIVVPDAALAPHENR